MNPKLLAAVFAVVLLSPPAFADQIVITTGQHDDAPNMVLINPGDLFNGVITVEYERALNRFLGLELGFSAVMYRGIFAPQSETAVVAFGPEVGVRFHFIESAPGGLWIGPSISGAYIASRNGGNAQLFGFGVSAAIGYNFIIARNFVIQVGLGGGFNEYGEGLVWSPHFRLGLGGTF